MAQAHAVTGPPGAPAPQTRRGRRARPPERLRRLYSTRDRRAHRRFVWVVFALIPERGSLPLAARHRQLPPGGRGARHPGGGRRPAHDRRRVRPLDRLDDRRLRHHHRPARDRVPRPAGTSSRWRPPRGRGANGYLVLKTGLPSFIVTLATLFIVRGLSIGHPRQDHRHPGERPQERARFDLALTSSPGRSPSAAPATVSILWWLRARAPGDLGMLHRFGNWIFGVGGKFRPPATSACRSASSRSRSSSAPRSPPGWWRSSRSWPARRRRPTREQREFFAIIAVVIGGTLLTGGYGSAVGAVFWCPIGMVTQGIVYAGIDADWNYVVLGAMLMVAVVVSTGVIRQPATEARR